MFITDYLEKQAHETPEAIALSFQGEETSYRDFYEKATRIAAYLQQIGLKKGDVVGSMLLNSDLFMSVYYGVQLAGCTLLPINTKLAPNELTYIFEHSEAKVLLYDERLLHNIEQTDATFDSLIPKQQLHSITDTPHSFTKVPLQKDDTALLLYTSGTTGRPKGVMITHENIISAVSQWATEIGYVESDRVVISIPLFHCAGLHVIAVSTIYSGATLIIEEMFVPDEVIPSIYRNNVTIFTGVPMMYALLLSKFNFANEQFPAVRKMVYGSAPMPDEVIKTLKEAFPNVTFNNLYGQTETTPGATVLPDEAVLTKLGSVGKALPETKIRVINARGDEVANGVIGEICIRGNQVMKGYYKNPEETEKVLQDGWLLTGDLGYIDDDGYVFIVDRKKDLIIRGGENIYPLEVENVLYEMHGIIDAAVIGVPDPLYGEVPKAIVVLKERDLLSEEAIQRYAREKLAKYKVPAFVEIVDDLPRNPSGKILKHVLRDREKSKID